MQGMDSEDTPESYSINLSTDVMLVGLAVDSTCEKHSFWRKKSSPRQLWMASLLERFSNYRSTCGILERKLRGD